MSRSRPQDNAPNPANRWFEWNGGKGLIRYYDKATKQNVELPLPFTFLLLDQLGGVGGWHDTSDTSIYSNAVKDVRQEVLVVKTKKDGVIAEGPYKTIRDRVQAVGGHYEAQCYIAYKGTDGDLNIGCLRFHGAALHAWAEFAKAQRSELYTGAISITGYTEGKKGSVTFRVPTFTLGKVSEQTNGAAVALDAQFQTWLDAYLARPKGDAPQDHTDDEYDQSEPEPEPVGAGWSRPGAVTDDDIPF